MAKRQTKAAAKRSAAAKKAAATRAAKKAAIEAAAATRSAAARKAAETRKRNREHAKRSEAAKRGAETRRRNLEAKRKAAAKRKKPAPKKAPPKPPPKPPAGETLKPGMLHAGIRYQRKASGGKNADDVKVELAVRITKGGRFTAAQLPGILNEWATTGELPDGIKIRELSWQHGQGAKQEAEDADDIEYTREQFVSRLAGAGGFHLLGGSEGT